MTLDEVMGRLSTHNLTLLSEYTRPEDVHRILCHCGNIVERRLCNYVSSGVKSCGCALKGMNAKNILNKRFGKLLAIQDTGNVDKHGNHLWLCDCDCGRSTITTTNNLLRKNTQSCGGCNLMRNGKATSRPALKINELIGAGIHNYQALPKVNIDIALLEGKHKIAIEYNGWYYHQHTQHKDMARAQLLLNNGWKVLVIQGRQMVPTQTELLEFVDRLNNTNTQYIIHTMNDWVTS